MKSILGRKIGMTRIFDENGKAVPVTLVETEKSVITQVKTKDKDGYNAIQIGYGKAKHINKPKAGHLKKSSSTAKKLAEFRVEDIETYKVGDKINPEFAKGDKLTVSAISKGKGFAGSIKRHHFNRGPETHGSDHHRAPGSVGSQQPQRVLKGKRLPGRMGHEKVTVKNLELFDIENENIFVIKGAVPGPINSIVEIRAL